MNPNLTIIRATPDAPAPPSSVRVPDGVYATAVTLKGRLDRVVATLSGTLSTDVAMAQARREALQIGTEMQRLGRRL